MTVVFRYLPLPNRCKEASPRKRKGMSEREIRRRLEKQGWKVWRGDEFVSIVDCRYEDVAQVARRLLDSLGEPVLHRRRVTEEGEIRYQDINVSPKASIGYAKLSPEYGSARDCLQLADEALYCAKKLGRNRIIGYHEVERLCQDWNANARHAHFV